MIRYDNKTVQSGLKRWRCGQLRLVAHVTKNKKFLIKRKQKNKRQWAV